LLLLLLAGGAAADARPSSPALTSKDTYSRETFLEAAPACTRVLLNLWLLSFVAGLLLAEAQQGSNRGRCQEDLPLSDKDTYSTSAEVGVCGNNVPRGCASCEDDACGHGVVCQTRDNGLQWMVGSGGDDFMLDAGIINLRSPARCTALHGIGSGM
jgi:hypothetical protein